MMMSTGMALRTYMKAMERRVSMHRRAFLSAQARQSDPRGRAKMHSASFDAVVEDPETAPPCVSVFSDYDTLKSVVIGRADFFRLPMHEHEPLMDERAAACKAGVPQESTPEGNDNDLKVGVEYPQHVIQSMNQSLDGLSHILADRGVEVFRSDMQGMANQHPATGIKGHSARDLMISIGDTLFLAPTAYRSRSHEVDEVYGHIIESVKESGNGKVVDLRTPQYWEQREKGRNCYVRQPGEAVTQIPLTETLPLFDAANCFVLNDKTLVYMISISANRAGAERLQDLIAPMGMNLQIIEGIYHGSHIDSTVLPLSKDRMLFNHDRISHEQMMHYFTQHGYNSDSFIGFGFDDMVEIDVGFNPVSSAFLGLNVLQVSPTCVVVEAKQTKIAQKLESCGFEVLRVSMPYTRDFAGAFHCVTCPLERLRDE